ncbi:MAG: Hsp20/alpha crystallin family protein [Pseudomonadota bacterium]
MGQGRERIPGDWMWAYAARLLEDAERLQRSFFEPGAGPPAWRPPVDVCEQDGALTVIVALPGVPPERLTVAVEETGVRVRGERSVPLAESCVLHRLEIPHGRFERHLPLPPGPFRLVAHDYRDGCLYLTFERGSP